jgi:2-aminoethylphosphonate-pyruvate transaminase
MQGIGLKSYLPPAVQSHIITSFVYPKDSAFVWTEFYRRVAEKGFLLYPGKISQADTFRIGNIGRLFEKDMRAVVNAIAETLREMGVKAGRA